MAGAVALVMASAGCGDEQPEFEVVSQLDGLLPGDVIALRADGARIEYLVRREGTIVSMDPDAPDAVDEIARVEVGTEGEQRGILGHAVIDGRRYAAWTMPDTLDLVVGEVTSGAVDRIVWNGTATQSKAIGGHLDVLDGRLLLGLGSLTDWAQAHGSGALVTLDPNGSPDQEPTVHSDGWSNPFAFLVARDGTVWVADNAMDGSDLPVDERAREVISASGEGPRIELPPPQRAPSAIVELPDGRLGVCGFLDNEMRAYEVVDD